MIAYRIEIWCSGDCGTRYLGTQSTPDLPTLPGLAMSLQLKARHDGWTEDMGTHWCPQCTRQRSAEAQGASVCAAREENRLGGTR